MSRNAAVQRRRQYATRRCEALRQRVGGTLRQRATPAHFQRAAQRARAQRPIALDLARHLHRGGVAMHRALRPDQGGDGQHEGNAPHHERHDRPRDPAGTTECQHGSREHDSDDGYRRTRAACRQPGSQARALAVHQPLDGHEMGRLVTAYTNRLTPMRSAASCFAGGSLCTLGSSQPSPRSV